MSGYGLDGPVIDIHGGGKKGSSDRTFAPGTMGTFWGICVVVETLALMELPVVLHMRLMCSRQVSLMEHSSK
jgi:hypothetical protein